MKSLIFYSYIFIRRSLTLFHKVFQITIEQICSSYWSFQQEIISHEENIYQTIDLRKLGSTYFSDSPQKKLHSVPKIEALITVRENTGVRLRGSQSLAHAIACYEKRNLQVFSKTLRSHVIYDYTLLFLAMTFKF